MSPSQESHSPALWRIRRKLEKKQNDPAVAPSDKNAESKAEIEQKRSELVANESALSYLGRLSSLKAERTARSKPVLSGGDGHSNLSPARNGSPSRQSRGSSRNEPMSPRSEDYNRRSGSRTELLNAQSTESSRPRQSSQPPKRRKLNSGQSDKTNRGTEPVDLARLESTMPDGEVLWFAVNGQADETAQLDKQDASWLNSLGGDTGSWLRGQVDDLLQVSLKNSRFKRHKAWLRKRDGKTCYGGEVIGNSRNSTTTPLGYVGIKACAPCCAASRPCMVMRSTPEGGSQIVVLPVLQERDAPTDFSAKGTWIKGS
ncbi:hypothetical protein Vi05172_g1042 [Venturia inaequalis]|nr:hypothetical protein Vi05172_g1042 [Venturia inaequalis]